jgi:peptidase M15-like protein
VNACAVNGGPQKPAWLVSGTQEVQAVELPLPEAVPDKDDVPPGDTVTFTVQIPWASSFFVAGGWRWVPDTTTNTSTIVGNPCGRQVTCKVVVRERGHVEVDDIRIIGNPGGPQLTMGAKSKIISIHAPQFEVTASPTSIPSAQAVTFTASVDASIAWSITSWAWTPDSGTGGIAPNGCAVAEKVCTRTISKSGWMKATTTISPYTLTDSARVILTTCDEEVQTIIGEYQTFQVNLQPACADFTNNGGTANFSWSELNGGWAQGNPHQPWGMVTGALTTGLEATRTNYNRGGVLLTSGYRCPHGNADVGGVANSLHMHGRAGDMYSAEHTWTEEEFLLLKQAAESTNPTPVESFDWNTYPNDHHYHAAW